MIRGVKICGISDAKTLNYIIHHAHPPQFIGFIANYKKSRRYVEFKKLKELINIDKKEIKFVKRNLKNHYGGNRYHRPYSPFNSFTYFLNRRSKLNC